MSYSYKNCLSYIFIQFLSYLILCYYFIILGIAHIKCSFTIKSLPLHHFMSDLLHLLLPLNKSFKEIYELAQGVIAERLPTATTVLKPAIDQHFCLLRVLGHDGFLKF